MRDRFHVQRPEFEYPEEAFPLFRAPIIRQARGDDLKRECIPALFGLIPYWAKDHKIGRHTYNARSETVSEKASYRNAWRRGQHCLVPMDAFYEPNYESGKPIRWKISLSDREPFAVAGIWDRWTDPATRLEAFSFSMLTVNADDHPVMRRFQRPGDEKRTIVIVPAERYDDWLEAEPGDAPELLQVYPAEKMVAEAAPRVAASK